MFATCVQSARAVGVTEDFHAWTDAAIPGAICHDTGYYEHNNYLFKFEFLLKSVATLNYDYFVFLDADNYFVRDPGDIVRYTRGAPIHVALEADASDTRCQREDWWGCPLDHYVQLMRNRGVLSHSVFNTNAGFWIVHRDAAERMVELAMQFWQAAVDLGYKNFTEEPPLAYVGHMLVGNPYAHTVEQNRDLWATDWMGHFADRLPIDQPWRFEDYFVDEVGFEVRPAIVHCMRSKNAMLRQSFPHRLPIKI